MQAKDIKVLLIQLRRDQVMIDSEFNDFVRSGQLDPRQITVVNVFRDKLSPNLLDGIHLLIIAGTSDDELIEKDTTFRPVLKDMLVKCRQNNIPVLGACWGGQFMASALGGEVIKDVANEELGTYLLYKEPAAKDDPVFGDFPEVFLVQIGHAKRATKLPDGAVNLLRSDLCQYQAFTWPGLAQYAMLFHPELNKEAILGRLMYYRDRYAGLADPLAFDAIITEVKETPWTDNLVAKFIERIVLPRFNK